MEENKIKLIYEGKVIDTISVPLNLPPKSVDDIQKGANFVRVNEEGTALMQVKHEFISVGETIAQVKYNTAAQVTEYGTIKVTQFKQEIGSRGEEVWYFKNATGVFEGTLEQVKEAFPDADFSDLKIEGSRIDRSNPEFANLQFTSNKPKWTTQNEYDGEKEGRPTTWDKWADATQLALDGIGLIPGIGEFADCANGIISLARGNYADATLSFAAMIPFFGTSATVAKHAKKLKKIVNPENITGVYDLIVKKGDDIQGYVGKSKNVLKRMIQHFNPKRGKLKETILEKGSIFHKMKGATDLEMEMYENYVIIKKYSANWKRKGYLLNKVNPVGGRYNLKTDSGILEFYKDAEKIAEKYGLPKAFEGITNKLN